MAKHVRLTMTLFFGGETVILLAYLRRLEPIFDRSVLINEL
jgi:hypothetical protein